MAPASGPAYLFGPYRLDTVQFRLLKDGAPVRLTPKAYETLLLLASTAGRTVTKDEILAAVWPDVAVEENNLTQHISALRRALGAQDGGASYIETVPRRGYRFAAPVRVIEGDGVPGVIPDLMARPVASRPWTPWLAAAIVCLVALAWWVRPGVDAGAQALPGIVIRPFAVVNGDADEESRARAITARLAGALRAASAREVVIRPAPEREPDDDTSAGAGPTVVVEGLLADRPRRRARVVLMDAGSQAPDAVFDASVDDDDEAAADSLAREIGRHLTAGAPANAARRERARLAGQRGEYFWHLRSPEALDLSVSYFEQALALDPDSAAAHAALAGAYAFDVASWQKAEALALRALSLDPDLGRAHAVIGFIRMFHQWRWEEAEQAFRRARVASPRDPVVRQWYAALLACRFRVTEAIIELREALRLDPFSPSLHTDLGWLQFASADPDAAIATWHAVMRWAPDFVPAMLHLYEAYNHTGRAEAVAAVSTRLGERLPGHSFFSPARALFPDRTSGNLPALQRAVAATAVAVGDHYAAALHFAWIGDMDAAVDALARAVNGRQFNAAFALAHPALRLLRGDARYQATIGRLGLPITPDAEPGHTRP